VLVWLQPVIMPEDKQRIGEFVGQAPTDLQDLGATDFIHLDRSRAAYWRTGIDELLKSVDDLIATPPQPQPPTLGLQAPAPAPDGEPQLERQQEPEPQSLVRTNSVLATAKVEALLMEIDLEQYAAVFLQQGYSFVSDLLDADASKQQTCLSLRKCARMQAACRSDLSRVPVLAAR
jgi:hypothetical protein